MSKTYVWLAAIVALVTGAVYLTRPPTLEESVKANASNSSTTQQDNPQTNGSASSQQQGPVTTGSQALVLEVPDFEVETTDGGNVKLSDLVADKPTVVGFWASWCHNCQRNLPKQQVLYQKYKDDINIVEVNLGEEREEVDQYVNGKSFGFHMAYDERSTVSRQWQIRYTNTHFLISSSGKLVKASSGDLTEEQIQELIAES